MYMTFRTRRWHRDLHLRNLRRKGGKKKTNRSNNGLKHEPKDEWTWRSTFTPMVMSAWSSFLWLISISMSALIAIIAATTTILTCKLADFIDYHRLHKYIYAPSRRTLLHKFLHVFLLGVTPLYAAGHQGTAINDELFYEAGRRIIRRDGSRRLSNRKFKAYFGSSPAICLQIWQMINPHEHISSYAKPVHLLWALMLIKIYATEDVLSGIAGVTKKNVQKMGMEVHKSCIRSFLHSGKSCT